MESSLSHAGLWRAAAAIVTIVVCIASAIESHAQGIRLDREPTEGQCVPATRGAEAVRVCNENGRFVIRAAEPAPRAEPTRPAGRPELPASGVDRMASTNRLRGSIDRPDVAVPIPGIGCPVFLHASAAERIEDLMGTAIRSLQVGVRGQLRCEGSGATGRADVEFRGGRPGNVYGVQAQYFVGGFPVRTIYESANWNPAPVVGRVRAGTANYVVLDLGEEPFTRGRLFGHIEPDSRDHEAFKFLCRNAVAYLELPSNEQVAERRDRERIGVSVAKKVAERCGAEPPHLVRVIVGPDAFHAGAARERGYFAQFFTGSGETWEALQAHYVELWNVNPPRGRPQETAARAAASIQPNYQPDGPYHVGMKVYLEPVPPDIRRAPFAPFARVDVIIARRDQPAIETGCKAYMPPDQDWRGGKIVIQPSAFLEPPCGADGLFRGKFNAAGFLRDGTLGFDQVERMWHDGFWFGVAPGQAPRQPVYAHVATWSDGYRFVYRLGNVGTSDVFGVANAGANWCPTSTESPIALFIQTSENLVAKGDEAMDAAAALAIREAERTCAPRRDHWITVGSDVLLRAPLERSGQFRIMYRRNGPNIVRAVGQPEQIWRR